MKLTTQHYQLPNGRIIHRKPGATQWGIDPDLKVTMTDQQVVDLLEFRQDLDVLRDNEHIPDEDHLTADDILERGLDPQLEAALLVIKTRLLADRLALAR